MLEPRSPVDREIDDNIEQKQDSGRLQDQMGPALARGTGAMFAARMVAIYPIAIPCQAPAEQQDNTGSDNDGQFPIVHEIMKSHQGGRNCHGKPQSYQKAEQAENRRKHAAKDVRRL